MGIGLLWSVCRRILTDPGCWGFRQYTLGNSHSQEGEQTRPDGRFGVVWILRAPSR